MGVGLAGFLEFAGGSGFLVGFADGFLLLAGFGLAAAFFSGGFAGGGLKAGPAVLGGGGFLFSGFFGGGFFRWGFLCGRHGGFGCWLRVGLGG